MSYFERRRERKQAMKDLENHAFGDIRETPTPPVWSGDTPTPLHEKLKSYGAPQVTAPAPSSASTVGRLVVMLDRSYGNYSERRATLENEIAERQEELRQVNTAIASLGAALLATATDPVLTDDERAKAEAPIDEVASLEGVDLTDPHQFEKYPPHSPERWAAGLSGMVAPRNEVTDAV